MSNYVKFEAAEEFGAKKSVNMHEPSRGAKAAPGNVACGASNESMSSASANNSNANSKRSEAASKAKNRGMYSASSPGHNKFSSGFQSQQLPNNKILPAGGIKISFKGSNSNNAKSNDLYQTLFSPPSLPTSSLSSPPPVTTSRLPDISLSSWLDLGSEQFNQSLFEDDTVSIFAAIWQKELKVESKENFSLLNEIGESTQIVCEVVWHFPNGNILKGVGSSLVKKDARKCAVRNILIQLGKPPPEVYESIGRWMVNNLKNILNAESNAKVEKNPATGKFTYMLIWKIQTANGVSDISASGFGQTQQQAEFKAMQNIFLMALNMKEKGVSRPSKVKEAVISKLVSSDSSKNTVVSPNSMLSKNDISEINRQHNSIITRCKIQSTEKTTNEENVFKTQLDWTWKSNHGQTHLLSTIGIGMSKAHSRAEAAFNMMVKLGIMEMITPKHRSKAREILALAKTNIKEASYLASVLIEESNCSVWTLFLVDLWKQMLAERSYESVDIILAALKNATSNPKEKQCMTPDLWESMLDECTVLTDNHFGQSILTNLGELCLEKSWFFSPSALEYFCTYRLMLTLEWQAQLAGVISEKKESSFFFNCRSLLLNVKSVFLPVVGLGGSLKQDERDWLMNLNMRERDYVLIRPYDDNISEADSWLRCTVGEITSVKNDFTNFQVNLRIRSGEGTKYSDTFLYSQMKLYYLSSTVTHDRMVQSLRALTQHQSHPSQYLRQGISAYSFTPEIRYLILHTTDTEIPNVAANGKVPPLINVDSSKQSSSCSSLSNVNTPSKSLFSDRTKKSNKQFVLPDFNDPILLRDLAEKARLQAGTENLCAASIKLPTDLPLTEPQANACLSALTNRLTLVQGPPGTGKTHVACAIIDSWQRQDLSKKILAVADSNVAADNLMEGLKRRGIRAVRIGSGSECDFQDDAIQDMTRYEEYLNLKVKGMYKEARVCRMCLFKEAVRTCNIIIATCVGSGHEMFDDVCFQRVIIDECAQAIEPSTLIPLGHFCNNLVLIGDHKQLPPTIVSQEASSRGLDISLLERFIKHNSSPIHLLDTQRRMHPSIAEFPNMQFYEGKLKNADVDDVSRPLVRGFAWPNKCCRICLVNVCPLPTETGFEKSYSNSKYNPVEIPPILNILQSCIENGSVTPDQIGVLTPYDAQKARLRKVINDFFPASYSYQIEIDSVDGFQGKEKDLIIFSAVRSNLKGEIGFLEDPRRMNVMLTRARRGIIVVGDQSTLSSESANWRPWVQYVEAHRSIISHLQLKNYIDLTGSNILEESSLNLNMSSFLSSSSLSNTSASSVIFNSAFRANSSMIGTNFIATGFQSQWMKIDLNSDSKPIACRTSSNHKSASNKNNSSGNDLTNNNLNSDAASTSVTVSNKVDQILKEEEEFEKFRQNKLNPKKSVVDPSIVDDWEQLL